MTSKTDREIALETQSKFQFYFLGLVFTLLAVSVQTAKLGVATYADGFELVGWISLLVSGIAGLWHMEYVPIMRVNMARQSEYEEEIADLKKMQLQGQTQIFVVAEGTSKPIGLMIQNREKAVSVLKDVIKKHDRSNYVKYQVHRWGFILGIVCVMISRAYMGLTSGSGSVAV